MLKLDLKDGTKVVIAALDYDVAVLSAKFAFNRTGYHPVSGRLALMESFDVYIHPEGGTGNTP
jgi:hypothetical protein